MGTKRGRRKREKIRIVLTGILEKVSQSESKRAVQILTVLDYLLKKQIFNVNQLVDATEVSRDSIDKTIKNLKQNGIIKLKKRRYRGGNLYQIKSKPKLKQYRNNLQTWQAAKIVLRGNVPKGRAALEKTITRNFKKEIRSSRIFDEADKEKQFLFANDRRQRRITTIPFPQPIIINKLPRRSADKIMRDYFEGQLCEICRTDGCISYLQNIDSDMVCENGHEVDTGENRASSNQYSGGRIQKKSKRISDSEFQEQRTKYLRRPLRSKTEDEESSLDF